VCVGGGKEEYFGFVVESIIYLFGSFSPGFVDFASAFRVFV
jgi:hypothetical protein